MADLKHLWQSQKTEETVSLETVQARAAGFQRRIRRRNLIEYAAGAIVIPVFAWYIYALPGLMVKIGSGLCLAGLVFILWQLHRRGSAEKLPDGLDLTDFHRRALVRQRDALKAVWKWYVAPVIPGFAVMLAGFYFDAPVAARALVLHDILTRLLPFLVAVIGWVLFVNARGARKLQQKIDELDKQNAGERS